MIDHHIHHYCCVGTMEEVEEWAGACFNCYFGIAAEDIKVPSQRAVANRLLLETVSPFICQLDKSYAS